MTCQKAEKSQGASAKTAKSPEPTRQLQPAKQKQLVTPVSLPVAQSAHLSVSSQAEKIASELKWLKEKKAQERKPPESFFGKFAYRGVGSNPNVYRKRDGFLPHQVDSIQKARAELKNLAFKENGLRQHAYRWQVDKSQQDGFFLSTGLSANDAYDNYPFLYRIDIGGLRYREWDDVGFEFKAESVADCWLYTDSANVDASSMIAIICLAQGSSRSYELLIMSPVRPDKCAIEDGARSKAFISFDAWTKKYGKGKERDGSGAPP